MIHYEEVRALYELSASEGVQAIVEAADKRISELEAALADLKHRPNQVRALQAEEKLAWAEAALAAVGSDLQDEVEYTITLRERAEHAEAELAERAEEVGRMKVQLDTLARFPETNHARAIIAGLRARAEEEVERPGLCVECGHYLSAFRTCAIGLPSTCNRNWPNARCRLTPSKWTARAEEGSEE